MRAFKKENIFYFIFHPENWVCVRTVKRLEAPHLKFRNMVPWILQCSYCKCSIALECIYDIITSLWYVDLAGRCHWQPNRLSQPTVASTVSHLYITDSLYHICRYINTKLCSTPFITPCFVSHSFTHRVKCTPMITRPVIATTTTTTTPMADSTQDTLPPPPPPPPPHAPPVHVHALPQPYPHQVGGHGQLAMTKPGQVLKPLVEREKNFYHYIHSDALPVHVRWIRQFTPKFYGEFDFPSSDSLVVQPSPCPSHPEYNPNNNSNNNDNCVTCNGKLVVNSPKSGCRTAASHSIVPQWRSAAACDGQPDNTPANISPWAAQMRLKMQMRTSTSTTTSNSTLTSSSSTSSSTSSVAAVTPSVITAKRNTFNNKTQRQHQHQHHDPHSGINDHEPLKRQPSRSIALEDINRNFLIPCVMDCKLGVRHYDDDATPEKRRRHIAKALRTTTATCGVRYTGMQSFKRISRHSSHHGMYETTSKYDGRKLREDDLIPEATWFFHDDFDVRCECVRMMIDRLVTLRGKLLRQHHFFLYSSSLLLVYEGAGESVREPRVDVRMIDFAHTVRSNGLRDDGYLKGVNYVIHILSQVLLNERAGLRRLPPRVICAGGAQRSNGRNENGTGHNVTNAPGAQHEALLLIGNDDGQLKSE